MLAGGLLVTDAQAGIVNDKEETVEFLKTNYKEYIKSLCTVYIAVIDAAIEDLENYLKYNKGSKSAVNDCIKLLKLYKSAFTDLLNRKSISTIQKTIRKVSGNFWLPPKEDANYMRYSRAIIAALNLLPTPTQTGSTNSSFAVDINNLFRNFKNLVSPYVEDISSTAGSGASTAAGNQTATNATGDNSDSETTSSVTTSSSSSTTSNTSSETKNTGVGGSSSSQSANSSSSTTSNTSSTTYTPPSSQSSTSSTSTTPSSSQSSTSSTTYTPPPPSGQTAAQKLLNKK